MDEFELAVGDDEKEGNGEFTLLTRTVDQKLVCLAPLCQTISHDLLYLSTSFLCFAEDMDSCALTAWNQRLEYSYPPGNKTDISGSVSDSSEA